MNTTQKIEVFLKTTPFGSAKMVKPILKKMGISSLDYFTLSYDDYKDVLEFDFKVRGKPIVSLKESSN